MSTSQDRRSILKAAGLAAGASLFPAEFFAAVKGIDAPRIALIIGNSKYPDSPLTNPVNDAAAMTRELKLLGFDVQSVLDSNLKDLTAAIQSYSDRIAKSKAVGLFYYAGHGVQLAWRNYLIPVDATIDRVDDIPKKSFELNAMLARLDKAQNPMNIIILDACRDNPFGKKLPVEQKGLSQFDAPPNSLLCYATAPGNVASDGAGTNGLFTENLLREIRNPEAKIEDVFKRVRLKVRLASKGQQVPWESTSLEQDFYFNASGIDPAALEAASKKESIKSGSDQDYEKQLALWEKASASKDPQLTIQYLDAYPSGYFFQLAELRLDQLQAAKAEKKPILQATQSNPFTKGSASGVFQHAIGDTYSFERKDTLTGIVDQSYTETVTATNEGQVTFNNGGRVIDLSGNDIVPRNGRFLSPAQYFPYQYHVGEKWSTRYKWLKLNNKEAMVQIDFKIVARQEINTPAGTFNAFLIQGSGYDDQEGTKFEMKYWVDPDKCKRPVKVENFNTGRRGRITAHNETVLTSYKENKKA